MVVALAATRAAYSPRTTTARMGVRSGETAAPLGGGSSVRSAAVECAKRPRRATDCAIAVAMEDRRGGGGRQQRRPLPRGGVEEIAEGAELGGRRRRIVAGDEVRQAEPDEPGHLMLPA